MVTQNNKPIDISSTEIEKSYNDDAMLIYTSIDPDTIEPIEEPYNEDQGFFFISLMALYTSFLFSVPEVLKMTKVVTKVDHYQISAQIKENMVIILLPQFLALISINLIEKLDLSRKMYHYLYPLIGYNLYLMVSLIGPVLWKGKAHILSSISLTAIAIDILLRLLNKMGEGGLNKVRNQIMPFH